MTAMRAIHLLTVHAALLLAGCVHVKIDEDRQVQSQLRSGDAVVLVASPQASGVASEQEFLDCLEGRLAGQATGGAASTGAAGAPTIENAGLSIVPHAAFVDSLYPWMEPSTSPQPGDDFVRTLLARPGVKERIAASRIRYLVSISGVTNTTDKDGSFTCSIGTGFIGGCIGLAFWKKESDYEATIWDMQAGGQVGTVGTKVDGRSVFVGAIAPLPFVAPVRRTACAKFASELRNFLLGKDVTTTQSKG